ncbi:hypothetical protein [Natronospora cellulosivora (SeqCode)]
MFFWDEIKRIKKNKRFVCIILMIQCIFCFFFISVLFANTNKVYENTGFLKEFFEDRIYYLLSDNMDHEIYLEYMNSEFNYYRLHDFVKEIRKDNRFDFISTQIQPLEININTAYIPEKYIFGYESGFLESPFKIDGKDGIYLGIKSLKISDNVFSLFEIEVDKGRNFLQTDFVLDTSRTTKIILGYEYQEIFAIGDLFEAIYISEEMVFEVVGFLPKDAYLPVKGNLIFLDRYMIKPAFSKIAYNEYPEFAKITLLQQANGQILTTNYNLNISQIVSDLSLKYNTVYFDVNNMNNQEFTNIINISEELLSQLIILLVTIVLFTILSLVTSILGIIHDNYYRFGVHFMNGARVKDIKFYILGLLFYLIIIPVIISLFLSLIFLGIGLHILMIIILSISIYLLSAIAPIIAVNNINISDLIGRKE